MTTRTVYVADSDIPQWDEFVRVSKRRGMSLSKALTRLVRQFIEEDRRGIPVPIGVPVPASMKDPAQLERERLADDIRAQVLEMLERQGAES